MCSPEFKRRAEAAGLTIPALGARFGTGDKAGQPSAAQ
jgi:hypothetical protein